MKTNKITKSTQNLIAMHTLKSGFDILTKRVDRQLKPMASNVYDMAQKGSEVTPNSAIIVDYRFEDKDKARTLSEGIHEFSARFPEYGEKLKDIIKETRKTKKRYLTFGSEKDLPNSEYKEILENIGVPEHMHSSMTKNIRDISNKFSRKNSETGLVEILIK